MVTRHLLDSLAIAPQVRGPRVLDVGTGPGLPGIPLAIALPQFAFTLLDSNGKMLRFVTQAVGELGLKNVEVVQIRAESYRPAALFDTLVTRAFANIADMLAHTRHLCAPHGRFLAMKGRFSDEERAAIPAEYAAETIRLHVPGLEAERQLVILTRRI
jgi:16S rRNA (guanine527-N7)-methyltransferase